MSVKKFAQWTLDKNLVLIIILLIGFTARLYNLGGLPNGIHGDEAFAAYNSYSMVTYGVDAWGYHNPVYFIGCGSGMNVLNSYLMMPFIKVFGLSMVAVRLPQAICACLSLVAFYGMLKLMFSKKFALFGLLLLAICPWQIVMCRNDIESGLLSSFLIFATYFFVKAMDNNKYLYIAAVFYGLTLYCYAVIWPVLPFMILVQVVYAIKNDKIRLKSKEVIISAILLLLLAIPLLLFMLINHGIMNEISTSIISVPKMVYIRDNDVSMKLIPDNVLNLFNLLSKQQTSADFNSFAEYGLFYKYSNIFILIGGCCLLTYAGYKFKHKEYTNRMYMAIWMVGTLILGAFLVRVNVIRMNGLYPVLICCMTLVIIELSNRFWNGLKYVMLIVIILSFMSFTKSYIKNYNNTVAEDCQPDVKEALEYAMDKTNSTIYVDSEIRYAKVLFYSKMSPYEFNETVQYSNYPSAYLDAASYGRFQTLEDYDTINKGVYVISDGIADMLDNNEYEIVRFNEYAVAVSK